MGYNRGIGNRGGGASHAGGGGGTHLLDAFPRLWNLETFNQKLCYRKIFDRRAILALFTDEYATRDYVAQPLGAAILPRIFHTTDDPATVPFDTLREQFVLKPTHGRGWMRMRATSVRSNPRHSSICRE
jgi:hypothetical protein